MNCDFLGLSEKPSSLLVKKLFSYFLGNFWKHLGYFFNLWSHWIYRTYIYCSCVEKTKMKWTNLAHFKSTVFCFQITHKKLGSTDSCRKRLVPRRRRLWRRQEPTLQHPQRVQEDLEKHVRFACRTLSVTDERKRAVKIEITKFI